MSNYTTHENLDAVSTQLPNTIFIEQLSELIGKTATTIRTCATNQKYFHLIPRPFKMPHSRRLCWLKNDVVAWLESGMVVSPTGQPKRGRPTKKEAIKKAQTNIV
jgi:predicted DNA-binding transcriptional regulator AlpA